MFMEALIVAIQILCVLGLLAGSALSLWIAWVERDVEAAPQRRLAEVTPIAPKQPPPPPPAEEARKAA